MRKIDLSLISYSLLLILGAVLAFMLGGCGDAVSADASGCRETVQGVDGMVMPETSGLSCMEIKKIIELRPSSPGGFLAIASSPHMVWKCDVMPGNSRELLLRCRHHRRAFTVMKANLPT